MRHSCTQASQQNVKRPLGVSRPHQRHKFRPPGPVGKPRRSTHPPFLVRLVLDSITNCDTVILQSFMPSDNAKVLVTTSWDDGHPCDVRLANLMARHNVKGTFYVPLEYASRPAMEVAGMRELVALGMEIGSHTLTHPVLPNLPESRIHRELKESRGRLEDMLGIPVTSLCYPKGKFNRLVCGQASKTGYTVGRTTIAFRTELSFDPLCMPVSCEFALQTASIFIRHAVREGNFTGLARWLGAYRCETNPLKLARRIFDDVLARGGILHVWGHSWEIDEQNLWTRLEELFEYIGQRSGVEYVTNRDLLAAVDCPLTVAAQYI